VLASGFGFAVCLLSRGGRAVVPGIPEYAPAPTAPGWSFRVAGIVCVVMRGADGAQSRCRQVRKVFPGPVPADGQDLPPGVMGEACGQVPHPVAERVRLGIP
jgi:hypothetical protein